MRVKDAVFFDIHMPRAVKAYMLGQSVGIKVKKKINGEILLIEWSVFMLYYEIKEMGRFNGAVKPTCVLFACFIFLILL